MLTRAVTKNWLWKLTGFVICLFSFYSQHLNSAPNNINIPTLAAEFPHVPGELLIQFKTGITETQILDWSVQVGVKRQNKLIPASVSKQSFANTRIVQALAPAHRWRKIAIDTATDLTQLRTTLLLNPLIESVDLNYILTAENTPNDPDYNKLWGLNNTGQTGGVVNVDIDAPQAWDIQTGSKNIVVAVVDTGVRYNHQDLSANMWKNPGEIANNNVDDDGNGYIDDIYGYNFATGVNNPADDNGHGTHVAGTIGAVGNNGIGVVGINWNVSIMALKFMDAFGSGTTADAVSAIYYAIANGARVINASWGGAGSSTPLRNAISAANNAGVLFIAASGNGDSAGVGINNDVTPHYPSGYNLANIIAVASIDDDGAISSFSNYGFTTVDLGAPGRSIYSTYGTGNNVYLSATGTSMAAPHVTGAAALLLAQSPDMTHLELKQLLLDNVKPNAALTNKTISGGQLNINNAMQLLATDAIAPNAIADLAVVSSASDQVTLSWTATGNDGVIGTASSYDVRFSTAPITATNFDSADALGGYVPSGPSGTSETKVVLGLNGNTVYYFAVKASDDVGNTSVMSNVASTTTAQESVVFSENFDGASNWSPSSLWHASTHKAASPTQAMYYGLSSTKTYNSGLSNTGTITSPAINLQLASNCMLSFNHYLETENQVGVDVASVSISADNGLTWSEIYSQSLSQSQANTQWNMLQTIIDISAYDGQTILLEFSFNTVNNLNNDFEGWIVDDVKITGTMLNNSPPVANPGGPYSGNINSLVAFDGASSSDPEGNMLNFSWDFGDGSSGSGVTPAHSYVSAGVYTVSLVVNDGLVDSTLASTTATITDQIPVANPGGPYSVITNQTISFDGSASNDPDGNTLTYSWNFGDGNSGTGMAPSHTYTTAGQYTLSLIVNDGQLNSQPATTTVSVADQNQAPTANPGGPYLANINQSITFDGSASSDPENDSLSYAWDFGDGTIATGVAPTHVYTTTGSFTVSLVVNDGQLDSAAITTTAAIAPANQNLAPSANAGGPYSGNIDQNISFDGSASNDPEGSILSYAWDFGDGSAGTGVNPTHAYTTTGIFTVSLVVNDGQLDSTPATTTATITTVNQNFAPVANPGGPYSAMVDQTISFDGSASSDPDGNTLSYSWDFGDGTSGTGMNPNHAYTTTGSFSVSLIVNDGQLDSLTVTTTATIVAVNQNLIPIADPGGPYQTTINAAITFDGSGSSDPDGDTLSYLWNFGDNSTGSGMTPTHAYTDIGSGSFTVSLTVNDGLQNSVVAFTTVTVSNQKPIADLGGPYSGAVNQSITFDASGSSDPDGSALKFSWNFGDGSAVAIGPNPNHAFSATGIYTITLVVDDGFSIVVASTTADIVDANQSLVANPGGPYAGGVNQPITFDGTGSSDPTANTLTYNWDFGDGSTGTGMAPTHAYSQTGNFTVTLIVSDNTSQSPMASTQVVIAIPKANPGGPYTVTSGSAVSFSGADSAGTSGNPLNYQWQFGDGTSGNGINPIHTYTAEGVYAVELIVDDGFEPSLPATTAVTVIAQSNKLLIDNFSNGSFPAWNIVDATINVLQAPSVWSASTGSLVQSSNIYTTPTDIVSAEKLGTYAFYGASSAATWTNYKVNLSMTSQDNDAIGVMFRRQDDNNYYRFSWDNERGYRRLVKRENGSFTVLAEDTNAYTIGVTYAVEIRIINISSTTTSIVVNLWSIDSNGNKQQLANISAIDNSPIAQGTIGLYSWRNSGSVFDNIVVEDLTP